MVAGYVEVYWVSVPAAETVGRLPESGSGDSSARGDERLRITYAKVKSKSFDEEIDPYFY